MGEPQKFNLEDGYLWAPYTVVYGEPTIIDGSPKEKTFMKVKEWLEYKKRPITFVSPGVYKIERDFVVSNIPDSISSRYAEKPINEKLYGKINLEKLK